ncbi:FDLD family class I lanthipeptide [Cytobacillus sp. FSL K6-0265]|uniref:FDLD family class I lanthipeptide n=1 Tax=Cytobacillus sp. FSL K6-0265 TaxID=2921448 RepID=UPI0030F8108C
MSEQFDLDIKVQDITPSGAEEHTFTSIVCKLITTGSGCCPENTIVAPSCDIC